MSRTDSHNRAENGGGGNRTREPSRIKWLYEPFLALIAAVWAVGPVGFLLELLDPGTHEVSF